MMNTTPPGNGRDEEAPLERTFIEGDGDQPQPHSLDSGARIDATDIGTYGPPTASGSRTTASLPAGDKHVVLGSGAVVGVLGAGGMAKIYKIWNEKLEVHRAVKIMLPSHRRELMERFETEAKITAKLHHPNIVEIHTVGEWQELPYIEMEFIDGKSLDALINRCGKLPPAVCTAIGIFIARALAYAHIQEFLLYGTTYKGVIHRDLKPANIMISAKGEVKLMDFGIARPTETSLHTVDGSIVGTMQYLSPEQLDAQEIDCRTDIYSFGAILYEMVCGTKTFPQKTITNLLKMKSVNEYKPLGEFPFPIPSALAKISQKCLEHSKEARFDSAESLLEALQKCHATYTSETPEKLLARFVAAPEEFETGERFSVRRLLSPKLAMALGGLAAVGLAVLLVVLTRPEAPQPPPSAQAKQQPQPPRSEAPKPVPTPRPVEPELSRSASPAAPAKAQEPAKSEAAEKSQPRVSAPKPRPKKRVVKVSPVDRLKQRYETDDMLAAARKALDKDAPDDAVTALNAVGADHPQQTRKALYLLEAYIAAGKQGDARRLAAGTTLNDAQFDLLRGRIEEKSRNTDKALSYYQSALTKPSAVRSVKQVRSDALYYSAMIYDERYRQSPNPDTRMQALNSWNVVKRTYRSTQNHPRFKMANSRLATIR